jgi:ketosteroid isomerase-like protein
MSASNNSTTEEAAIRDRIRDVLAELISAHTRLQSRVLKAVTVGDIALLYTDFQGTTTDDLGTTVEIRHQAIEVLRRQNDVTWKLIVGDPNGRE